MAAPALGLPATQCTLRGGEEFRFEVPPGETVTLTLLTGAAEVFGAEMVPSRAYAFSGTQQAIFSWTGCSLEVQGQCGHSYVASETPMSSYLQLHGELDSRRAAALASGGAGPRVLVAGPADSGKSSLSRLLANYLTRSGHRGTLIDFDVEEGELCVPGSITAAPLCRPLDIERRSDELAPLAYWLGHTSAAEHVDHLRTLCAHLAHGVRQRHEADAASRAGGMIINTCGWVEGAGYDLLMLQAAELQADVLVVIGDDRLHSLFCGYASQSPLHPSVLKLVKSGGVITRSAASRLVMCSGRVREYFYGVRSAELYPHSSTLDFAAVAVFTIGRVQQAPSSALPIGMKIQEGQLGSSQLLPSHFPSLVHSVLSLVYADSATCDDLLKANSTGFVWVSHVDPENQKITLLAPAPIALGAAPLHLLLGSLKWTQGAAEM